jgi:hypothetical protein
MFAAKASAAIRLAATPFNCASPGLVGLPSLAPGAFLWTTAWLPYVGMLLI